MLSFVNECFEGTQIENQPIENILMLKDIPNERCYQVESARHSFIAPPGWKIRQFEPFYSLREKIIKDHAE